MKSLLKEIARLLAVAVLLLQGACLKDTETASTVAPQPAQPIMTAVPPEPSPSPQFPDLNEALNDGRNAKTDAPIGKFDFKNFKYPLPRGWHHPDGSDATLENGLAEPKFEDIGDDMSNEEKAEQKAARRIGLSYITTKFLDVTGDGEDDAAVILRILAGGPQTPQIAYLFTRKDNEPELIWFFRTGDRADGGLKDLRIENRELVIELYGQDRFVLGETETGKITGDEEQLCCPTFFTRSFYKWNGRNFLLQRKRLTYSIADPSAVPLENHGDTMNDPAKAKKYLDAKQR
ncbi:MAG: hypothetical protein ACT4O9_09455 [Blastocatellia bacterium]